MLFGLNLKAKKIPNTITKAVQSEVCYIVNEYFTCRCFEIESKWLHVLCRFVALYNYKPQKEDEVELKKGDYYSVAEACQDGWLKGRCLKTGKCGVFPGNYVQPVRSVSQSVRSVSQSVRERHYDTLSF